MKKHLKKSAVVLITVFVVLALSITAFAAGRWVQAWQDDALKINFNGVNQTFTDSDDGSQIVPLIYNGRTYLPVRAIATLVGLGVDYNDATRTVLLTSGSAPATPYKDSSSYNTNTNTTPVNNTTAQVSSNTGSINDPVKLGTSFSWADESVSTYFGFKSNVTMSVTNVKPLTDSDLAAMGFRSDSDSSVGYVLVSLNMKGKNVTPTTIEDNNIIYRNTQPQIWGAESTSGKYVIGGTDFGFDGSIERNLTSRYPGDADRINRGSSVAEIDYSGNVILPIIKGETNYLIMEKSNTDLDYNARKVYFKLN